MYSVKMKKAPINTPTTIMEIGSRSGSTILKAIWLQLSVEKLFTAVDGSPLLAYHLP